MLLMMARSISTFSLMQLTLDESSPLSIRQRKLACRIRLSANNVYYGFCLGEINSAAKKSSLSKFTGLCKPCPHTNYRF